MDELQTQFKSKDWQGDVKPINVDLPSPQLAVKGESDPQWFKDFQRDGVRFQSCGTLTQVCRHTLCHLTREGS
jgi:hypothetical protein